MAKWFSHSTLNMGHVRTLWARISVMSILYSESVTMRGLMRANEHAIVAPTLCRPMEHCSRRWTTVLDLSVTFSVCEGFLLKLCVHNFLSWGRYGCSSPLLKCSMAGPFGCFLATVWRWMKSSLKWFMNQQISSFHEYDLCAKNANLSN